VRACAGEPDAASLTAHEGLAAEVTRVNRSAARTLLRGHSPADNEVFATLGVPGHIQHAVVLDVKVVSAAGPGRRRRGALVVRADSLRPPPAPVRLVSGLGTITVYGRLPDGSMRHMLVAEFQDAAAAARTGCTLHELRDELERRVGC
jgi:hypothetical protein